jgi:opacity protein-like surface antigen
MNKICMLAISLGLCSTGSFAGTMGEMPIVDAWTPIMSLSLGPNWIEKAHSQTLFLTSDIEKTYTTNHNNNALLSGEAFFGWQHRLSPTLIGQIGAAVLATTSNKISGDIWDDADPSFDNFVYSYRTNHTQIAARGKLLADMGYLVMPYINGSLGVGFNSSHGYKDIPTISEAVVNPYFHSHTETTYSYTVGAGFDGTISDHWHAGFGYEFADWGKSQLQRAKGQTLGHGLSESHTYTHGLIFNVTYLI